MSVKYDEIIRLQSFCVGEGIACSLTPLFDGYILRFPSGADFVQHFGSYGSDRECVEPAGVDERYNYSAVPLELAKSLVLEHRDKLVKLAVEYD